MVTLRVTLRECLEELNITVYSLTQWVETISPSTLYAIANGSRRPSLEALEAILTALRAHGYSVVLADIVRMEEHIQKNV